MAKKQYYSNLFSKFLNDIKKTWRAINTLLNRQKNKDTNDQPIIVDGQKTTDEQRIADCFNKFFTNIGRKITDNLPPTTKTHMDYLTNTIPTTFSFKPVDEDDIDRIIKEELSTKTSFGEDGISTKLVKILRGVLVPPLTILCNQSLATGIFPDDMKIAKVIPIYKQGDKELVDNYRPISLLPAFSKVMERVMFEQIMAYFITNKLLSESQYGFLANRSTDQAAIELVDRISKILDNRRKAVGVFMDLSKAFDTLSHKILIDKLKHYGFHGTSLSLLSNYFNGPHSICLMGQIEINIRKNYHWYPTVINMRASFVHNICQ